VKRFALSVIASMMVFTGVAQAAAPPGLDWSRRQTAAYVRHNLTRFNPIVDPKSADIRVSADCPVVADGVRRCWYTVNPVGYSRCNIVDWAGYVRVSATRIWETKWWCRVA
jgi:hypothetical protein